MTAQIYNYKTDAAGEPDPSGPVKIWRETDSTEILRIMNDPAVFPMISVPGQEHFKASDFAKVLEDPLNVLIMTDGGGIWFTPDEPGIYEVHTNFLPTRRGRYALDASLAAYRWMFTHANCWMLQTRVPAINKPADAFCKLIGASLYFERAKVWPTKDGDPVDMRFYTLTIQDWARKYPAPLIESGRAFHKRLEEEFERHGITQSHHPDENCHDAAVGLCAEMIYGGQPDNAITLYNRWARFAGYGQIAMMQRNPMVLDIGDVILLVEGENFKVLKCRQNS